MRLETYSAADGQEIQVQISGKLTSEQSLAPGHSMVLLHEWASSHRVWEPIAHRLAEHFTIYRWDARGHGDSRPPPGGAVTVEKMADDLAHLIDHFRLHRPLVVGHSMGALTLWSYVARHGCDRLGKICVIDQSPRLNTDADWTLGIYGDWPRPRDDAFIDAMRRDFVTAVVELISCGLNRAARQRYEHHHPGIDRLRTYLAHLDPVPLIEVWPTLSRTDFRPALAHITVPALLVYGGQSNYYPPATGSYVKDAIKMANLTVYDDADHSPHVGYPDRFAKDLLEFSLSHP